MRFHTGAIYCFMKIYMLQLPHISRSVCPAHMNIHDLSHAFSELTYKSWTQKRLRSMKNLRRLL